MLHPTRPQSTAYCRPHAAPRRAPLGRDAELHRGAGCMADGAGAVRCRALGPAGWAGSLRSRLCLLSLCLVPAAAGDSH